MDNYNTFWKRLGAGFLDILILMPSSYFISLISDTENNFIYLIGILLNTLLYSAYFIWCHGKYGYTLGKKLFRLKVLRLNESTKIGLKRSFIRETVWISTDLIAIIYFTAVLIKNEHESLATFKENLNSFMLLTAFSWILIDLITMQTNAKRRSIQDFIAGSVVIKF